jgi:hypothetical protein
MDIGMRTMFVIMVLFFSLSVTAQTALTGSYTGQLRQNSLTDINRFDDSIIDKKWFVTKYIGLSTSFVFFKGGSATVFSAPVALQLNRKLNNNLYAFAAASVAPSYITFNNFYQPYNNNKSLQNNSLYKPNGADVYGRAELGLMYVNDAKTFSISGSVGIERSSYPIMPFNQAATVRPNNFVSPIKKGIQ